MNAELKPINDYSKVFNHLIKQTSDYICNNNLKCMVLGISGGIDSTVVAAICHEVSKRTGIPLIGRSLPTNYNKEGETSTADLVGKAFCNNYRIAGINTLYKRVLAIIASHEEDDMFECTGNPNPQTSIANGNIQARIRMMYLYNLASVYKGLVMDTDNLTENNLGYFTVHGDVGDFNPIGGLWKTEVFELAQWLFNCYKNSDYSQLAKAEAMWASLQLKPTAGLGITSNDLEELGAESYEQVDSILKEILKWKYQPKKDVKLFKSNLDWFLEEQQIQNISLEVITAVAKRHFNSDFKRKQLPIKIQRHTFID